MFCTGYLPTTATTEWTTFETIGGLQPTPEGLIFRPGLFIDAIESGRWLVIDELNRSNFDRAFGQLFTVLVRLGRGAAVQAQGPARPHLARAAGRRAAREAPTSIRVPANWRIIATMNVFDKNLLFDMSLRAHAPLRLHRGRHAARRGATRSCSRARARSSAKLLPLRKFTRPRPRRLHRRRPYAARRAKDGPTESRLIYEVFYAYFLPQFEGMDDRRATTLYRTRRPAPRSAGARSRPSAP